MRSRFPSLNLREMPLGNVDVSTQFLLQNLSVSLSLKTNHFLALFGKTLSPPFQIDVEGGGTVSPLRCLCKSSSWSIAR